jgi:hypothetical protein
MSKLKTLIIIDKLVNFIPIFGIILTFYVLIGILTGYIKFRLLVIVILLILNFMVLVMLRVKVIFCILSKNG